MRLGEVGIDRVVTSIIVAAELRYGVAKRRSASLADTVERILGSFPVLPFEPPADLLYGKVRSDLEAFGTPIGHNDMLIAAHALALDCILVTDNVREFSRIDGLTIENWLR